MVHLKSVVMLVILTYHSALTLALDPCDQDCILGRLADLELRQRASDAENHELRQIISQQQSAIESQARRIRSLEEIVTDLQHELAKQHASTLDVMQQDNQDAESDREDYVASKAEVADVKKARPWPRRSVDSNNDSDIVSQTKRQEQPGIAFSAYLDHDVEVANQQTIKLNKIITNDGNGYSIYTGVFTCPQAGMYLLTYVIGERDARYNQWVRMMVNNANLVDAAIDTWHAGQDLQGGNTVIVRLKAGDAVWLESDRNMGHVEGSTGSDRFTTFSVNANKLQYGTVVHSGLVGHDMPLGFEPGDHDCAIGRLADLELQQRANDLENYELRKLISQQQSTIEYQVRRIDTLEQTLTALQQEVSIQQALPTHYVAQQQKHSEPDGDDIDTIPAKDGEYNNISSWSPKNIDSNTDKSIGLKAKRQERTGIAFSTYLDHDVDVSDHQTIKFNRVLTNDGNGYSIHTGAFNCSEAGMYLLTYAIGERDERIQWIRLMVNSVNLVDTAVDT